MKNKPAILILSLYSGENEIEDSIASLEKQTYSLWSQEVFRFLPNAEAHKALYSRIMAAREEFDLFVKLDADVVLNRPTALSEMVQEFEKAPDLDHGIFGLADWASKQTILGLHCFSNRAFWPESEEAFFVDPNPEIPGKRRIFRENPVPLASHMPNPSLAEAFLFGWHRALKVVQRDSSPRRIGQAREQLNLLQGVWRACRAWPDVRREAVLWGAEWVFSGYDSPMREKSPAGVEGLLEATPIGEGGQPCRELDRRWNPIGWTVNWRRWRWIEYPRLAHRLPVWPKGKSF